MPPGCGMSRAAPECSVTFQSGAATVSMKAGFFFFTATAGAEVRLGSTAPSAYSAHPASPAPQTAAHNIQIIVPVVMLCFSFIPMPPSFSNGRWTGPAAPGAFCFLYFYSIIKAFYFQLFCSETRKIQPNPVRFYFSAYGQLQMLQHSKTAVPPKQGRCFLQAITWHSVPAA